MKKKLLLILLFFLGCSILMQAQHKNVSTFSGRIIDVSNRFPVADVHVYTNLSFNDTILSDQKGDFNIEIVDTLINLIFIHEEYDTLFYFINHLHTKDQLVYITPKDYIATPKTKEVKFKLLDAKTKQPIPFASISTKKKDFIDYSDDKGLVSITIDLSLDTLLVTDMNYKEVFVSVNNINDNDVIYLEELQNELQTVCVKASRTKYSNKDNPAVALIKKVIEEKSNNYLTDKVNLLNFRRYEKIQMGNYDFPRFVTHNFLTRRQAFIFDNIDTAKFPPHKLTPIYLQEKIYDVYIKDDVKNIREQLNGIKKVKFNENFIGNKSIDNYLTHLYVHFDLIDENVMVMTNLFMSPMAKMAPTFYKYFLGDTIKTEDHKELIELYFGPRNKNDFLFLGRLYINKENYAVEYAKMGLSKDINLNYVKDVKFDIRYTPQSNGKYIMTYNSLFADFNLTLDTKFGLYGEKITVIDSIRWDETSKSTVVWNNPKFGFIDEDSVMEFSKNFWDDIRPIPLTDIEHKAYFNMDSLYRQNGFNEKLKWTRFIFMGYFKTGKFEIGPTNTFYAYNPIEHLRLRFGGRTMINETKKYNIESYAAYGFKDKEWKWYISGALALYKDKKRILTEYPYNYIKFTHQNDLILPGQYPSFVQESNFFMAFKRGVNDKYIFNKYYKLEYFKEFSNHVRIVPFVQYTEQSPLGSWYYIKGDNFYNDTITKTYNTEFGLTVRWAPNEKIVQGRTSRTEINSKYPILTLSSRFALKDILGGDYSYQNYQLNIFKRVLIPQMGFINFRLKGIYIEGKEIPFTLLNVVSGNQTYMLNSQDYMLMNYMEFISDKSLALNAEYHLYGFLFNKIPLFKKLKFREVVGVKLMYGSLRAENLPIHNPNVFKFPINQEGRYTTTALGNSPYMETTVGVENILGIIRIDAIWRNTYLNMPNVSKFGVRVGFYFDF
jgi:hypothetical protein